ncbi:root hair defective 3-like protein isoform X2 [Tanacetum coccineum]
METKLEPPDEESDNEEAEPDLAALYGIPFPSQKRTNKHQLMPLTVLRNLYDSRLLPEMIHRFFNVQVVGLSNYEEKEGGMMRKMFFKFTEVGGLASDRQGVIPALGFSFSAQQIWKVIKENKDLDLPSHKAMVANIRCEKIVNEEYSSFTANEWLKLKELVKSNLVPGFGKKVSSLLGNSLSSYDKEATYFEESSKNAKRKQLEEKLIHLVRPTYQLMMEHTISWTKKNFKSTFTDALNEGKGFALAACDCTKKFMTVFDGQNQGRDEFSSDLDSHITEVLNTKLSELTTLNTSKLEKALYGPVEALLKRAFDEAIHDGVNVISTSFGLPPPLVPLLDSSSDSGSFHAMQKGISVVFSAEYNGPDPSIVLNVAPWSTCVGASSIDQNFPTTILLDNSLSFMVTNLICRATRWRNNSAVGAVIMCFSTQGTKQIDAAHKMNVTKVHIFPSKTVIKQSPAPVVAEFSSRCPNSMSPDILKTPMDLGAICNNLENELKYMNSAEVLKDVQYIWSNCEKYNKKDDHILELMNRVKTYFIKYWKAAGLRMEQTPIIAALELAHGHAPFSKYPPMKPEFEKVARLFNGAATTYPDGDTRFLADLGTITYAQLEIVTKTFNALFVDKAGRNPLLPVSAMGLLYQYPWEKLLLNNCSCSEYFSPSIPTTVDQFSSTGNYMWHYGLIKSEDQKMN